MPQNRRESFVYTVLMCAFMVFFMSVYNIAMMEGLSWMTIKSAWMGFPLAYVVGILCDWFLVSSLAKKIANKIVGEKKKRLIIAIPCCMVCGMVVLMSLFGALQHVGFHSGILSAWLHNIPLNAIAALPLQLIFAGPIVRRAFRKLFPVGETVSIS